MIDKVFSKRAQFYQWIVCLWVLTVCTLACTAVPAQTKPKLRVLLGNTACASSPLTIDFTADVASSIAAEFEEQLNEPRTLCRDTYELIGNDEAAKARPRLSIEDQPIPKIVNSKQLPIWWPLSNELKADVMVQCWFVVGRPRGHRTPVAIDLSLQDVNTREPIAHVQRQESHSSVRIALQMAVEDAVRQCLQRRPVRSTIVERMGSIVRLPIGNQDGVNPGDELTVVAEVNGPFTRVGRIKVAKVSAAETIADILVDLPGGIAAGNTCALIRRPGGCTFR